VFDAEEHLLLLLLLGVGTGRDHARGEVARGDLLGGFAEAASRPDLIGLSFGGGCFFENGVGMSVGSATFRLISYTIQ